MRLFNSYHLQLVQQLQKFLRLKRHPGTKYGKADRFGF